MVPGDALRSSQGRFKWRHRASFLQGDFFPFPNEIYLLYWYNVVTFVSPESYICICYTIARHYVPWKIQRTSEKIVQGEVPFIILRCPHLYFKSYGVNLWVQDQPPGRQKLSIDSESKVARVNQFPWWRDKSRFLIRWIPIFTCVEYSCPITVQ